MSHLPCVRWPLGFNIPAELGNPMFRTSRLAVLTDDAFGPWKYTPHSKTERGGQHDTRYNRRESDPLPFRLWHRQKLDFRDAFGRRAIAQDPCLLAGLQLPDARHDLSAGQSPAERAAEGRARQKSASGTLGCESWPGVHLYPSKPNHQEVRLGHDLLDWTRAWCTRCSCSGLFGRGLF